MKNKIGANYEQKQKVKFIVINVHMCMHAHHSKNQIDVLVTIWLLLSFPC